MGNQNPFDLRRYAGMFSGGPQPEPLMKAYRGVSFNQPQPQQVEQPAAKEEDPFLSAMGRLNQGQAAGAYRKHLTDMPDPSAYAPSKWRRLGAALTAGAASFGKDPQNAMALGSEVRDAPLKSALNEWQLKGAGLKEQADIEATDVKGQMEQIKQIREYIKQQNDQELERRRVDSTVAYNDARIKDLEAKGWQKQIRPDGNLWMVDTTGQNEPRNMGPTMEGRQQDWTEKYQGGQQQLEEGRLRDSQRRTGIMGQNAQTYANQPSGYVSVADQFTSNVAAAQEVARTDPKYAGWSLNDQGQVVRPGAMWGTNPVDMNSQDAKDFVAKVNATKQRMLNMRRPGPGGSVPGPIDFNSLPD